MNSIIEATKISYS